MFFKKAKKEITYATHTNIGKREVNEDSIGVCEGEDAKCFVLCDGLGGHGMGDIASSLVVNVFENQFPKAEKYQDFIADTYMAAEQILMAEQKKCGTKFKMKTTGTALLIDDKKAYIGHVGDSRVYVFSKNKVLKRTLDHSIPQMLALTGDIKESEIRHHKERSTLLKVIGIEWEEPMYEVMKPLSLGKCDAFLMCSDGFWELIEDDEMCKYLAVSNSVEEWLESMVALVKERGKDVNMDNNSAIAVWCK